MDSLAMKPEEIEAESFRIIDAEAGRHDWPPAEWQVVRRAVHTSADFEYVRSMVFSQGAVEQAVAALKSGYGIVTDTNMALSGISKVRLARFGTRVNCHVADPDVIEIAKQEGITRSIAAMRKAVGDPVNRIFVIGNAPTALFELLRLTDEGTAKPALIIGLPVGFVGAEESKNALAASGQAIPFITNIGRKGGSNVAAAVVNALAILAGQC
ncbi:precorrin-8X methylmutase [Pelobacter propionicus]|uniref:Precorrin-8X methylmutase n=1 Tax=Pelobacter propionicus (strain DSM 2379 / NBRC 103807 / OttBd1) TaxID=338966 RepID=A1ANJ8_PELPD|nr:precorrin-8X methylmutase [Pelobacter propionicus]ABK98918.1 precorrin-8X methylmutase [Pelobacter propionicus DSM 2379]